MTRDEAGERAKVELAFAAGADVQYWGGFNWCDSPDPNFHPSYKWRVKPKEPRHLWTVLDGNGDFRESFWDESDATRKKGVYDGYGEYAPYTVIHSIEVLP